MNVTWETLQLHPQLVETLISNQIEKPTPVQAATIPVLLAGQDVSAKSQTGTGKTLAYMLPALQRVDVTKQDVQVMVLAPTQELAMQIFRVAEIYGEAIGVKTQQLIGGASMQRQVEKLRQHPHVVVGTPGRIHELVKSGKLKLHHIRLVIIDEADQVFNLGSTVEVETLLRGMVRDRQIAFFSATRPQAMVDVEARWMQDPQRVDVTADQNAGKQVKHYFVVCERRDKADTARKLIRMLKPAAALLFINETDEIANYEAKLSYEGFSVETLYGDADKQKRASTLTRFREGRLQLLVATDVAARGLDIVDLPLVVHLDPALDADHYVHRSGRTGRMGKPGTVISIVTRNQLFIMDKFRKQLGIELQEKTMSHGKLWNPGEEQGSRGAGFGGASAGAGRSGSGAGERGAARGAGAGARPATAPDSRPAAPSVRGSAEASGSGGERIGGAAPAGRPGAAAKPAAKQAVKPTKSKRDQERERKNKGAPKWLKAKRDGEQQ
ncbi:DEAD/DEAH box helicase [Paenibacillus sp. CF384]|uniref:DEAD/DEAH box helicase n=1 Tax=Paenibacillus sp. CF384 TaxID=1884382 RepID=UPI000899877F|nr:DEAD/DEAH box helicase [Paenibacillus sp. CF384]SDW41135.1 Superfamily II DNA and RNA helicase [Paenibacillus sp. CF384]